MIFELIGTALAGLAAGLLVYALGRRFRWVPRGMSTVAAGVAMIAATISSEYGWFDRTKATLPPSFTVARTVEERALWRPWTYVAPFVNRFLAVDTGSVRENPAVPGQRIVTIYTYGRWQPVRSVPVLFDCAGHRQAPLADGAEFGASGEVLDADWSAIATDDPVFVAACGEA